jgi:hypothetical protein
MPETETETETAPIEAPIEPSTSDESQYNGIDLEKQLTESQSIHPSRSSTAPTRQRISRTQSLTRRNTYRNHFTHPLSHVKTTEAEIVDFDGLDDPYRPLNWPFRKKVITTMLYGLTTMGSTWASSVYSPAVSQVSTEYHVSTEVSTLGVSLLLLGFGLGPLLWAPLSEL